MARRRKPRAEAPHPFTYAILAVGTGVVLISGAFIAVGAILVVVGIVVFLLWLWSILKRSPSTKLTPETAPLRAMSLSTEFSDGVLTVSWGPDARVKYWRVLVKAGEEIINDPKTQYGAVTTRTIDLNGVIEGREGEVLSVVLDGEDAAEVNVAHGRSRVWLDGSTGSEPDRYPEVTVAHVEDESPPYGSMNRESDRKEWIVNTPYRPRVIGREFPEYDHVGTPDLRNWLKYWQGVDAGTRRLTPGSSDTAEMAPGEIAKLRKEIAAREAAR